MKIVEKKTFLKVIKTKKKIVNKNVLKIVNEVRKNGHDSLINFTKKFDNINIKKNLYIHTNISFKKLSKKKKKSIEILRDRIYLYHKIQKQISFKSWFYKDKYFKVLGQKVSSIRNIGLYVPAGIAMYPSSLLMSAIPALIAGVKNIQVVSPIKNIKKCLPILYAAKIIGIKKILRIGGAQAISALTFGTKSIKPVNKIVGPGNFFVSNAKKLLFGNVGIDMFAGPTELMIVCDRYSKEKFIVYDALAQMEHDPRSKLVIISKYKKVLVKTLSILKKKLKKQIKKKSIFSLSIKNCFFVFCKSNREIFNIVNKFAPEHLEILLKKPKNCLSLIKNAGSVFLGEYTTECLGDYIAGGNHILPTNNCAKFSSPLGVYDFLKITNITKVKKKKKVFKICQKLSKIEDLLFHYKSLKIRFDV